MRRLLVVNADDFGRSAGINEGVAAGHERGIVTSASLMVRWPAASSAASYARAQPSLSVGLHLDLGEWERCDGDWRPVYEVATGDEEIGREVRSQLDRFRELVGRDPTHLDSHQHVHRDGLAAAWLAAVGAELRIPVRASSAVRYCGAFYGAGAGGEPQLERVRPEALARVIGALPVGATELGCHPAARVDLESSYAGQRVAELGALCSPLVRAAVEEERIELCDFRAAVRQWPP